MKTRGLKRLFFLALTINLIMFLMFNCSPPGGPPPTPPLKITQVRPSLERWGGREYISVVSFKNKLWVLGGDGVGSNDVWSSEDGRVWKLEKKNAEWAHRLNQGCTVFDNRIWIIGGNYDWHSNAINYNDVWYSVDGINWIEATHNAFWSERSNLSVNIFDNKMWILGGTYYGADGNTSYDDVWYSENGTTWILATSDGPGSASYGRECVVFKDKMWIFHDYGAIYSSNDGSTWTYEGSNTQWDGKLVACCIYNNKIWMVFGREGYPVYTFYNEVWYSEDGTTWSIATSNAGWHPRLLSKNSFLEYKNKLWILGGSYNEGYDEQTGYYALWQCYNDVWSSSNGIEWTNETEIAESQCWKPRSHQSSAAFNNKMWVLGGLYGNSGFHNDVWSSNDGAIWLKETDNAAWPSRGKQASVVFKDKMWLFGGINGPDTTTGTLYNDVWCSENGRDWTLVTGNAGWSPRCAFYSVVFNGKMWVMGGNCKGAYSNDVWYSEDGENWTRATDNAGWYPRGWYPATVFAGKIWIGGWNDLWFSSDGINWIQAAIDQGWKERSEYLLLPYKNKLFIINGSSYSSSDDLYTFYNDVWSSADGFNWTRDIEHADWKARTLSGGTVFADKMWIFGGQYCDKDKNWYEYNDVWSIE